MRSGVPGPLRALPVILITLGLAPRAAAQTIEGRLLNSLDDRPIMVGLVILTTTEGDSVDATLSDDRGNFSVSSEDPGSFLLTAAALGYEETLTGIYELGPGGRMTIEFRLAPQPITLDGLLVHAESYRQEPALVRNGFYRRMQRGLGDVLTPEDLEKHPAMFTADLFYGMLGVRVRPGPFAEGVVRVRGPRGQDCTPAVFIDGIVVQLGSSTLSDVIGIHDIAAAEVYVGPAEIPIEYALYNQCGVLLFWTKS